MNDLNRRFGNLVAAHRRKNGLSQFQLAEQAGISKDMVSKIEIGASGASFRVIEKLATALRIDPAELFTPNLRPEAKSRAYSDLTARLAGFSEADLLWAREVLEAALNRDKR
ncbi:XRE family transcriptional regulator [Rhizobium deserti]|uniref:XRE family transcriptional regulator n=1 Tax=Rhizobium deserti TaxID=2547961 RepID=A0A4R5UJK0_9HYPH|nr:helix-turn-helix transcriptional regulator [Rhizobium deserti]TDK37030.1 XRE family transcriptional regulator [Rhizobium deserti]